MRKNFLSGLLLPLLLAAATNAQAGMGFAKLPGLQDDEAITVFYPSAGDDRWVEIGPYTL